MGFSLSGFRVHPWAFAISIYNPIDVWLQQGLPLHPQHALGRHIILDCSSLLQSAGLGCKA